MSKKTVIVRLTPEEADLVWRNVDGWMDAGSCEDGLEEDEKAALMSVEDQILRQIRPRTKKKGRSASSDRGE